MVGNSSRRHRYKPVTSLPIGVVNDLRFSPDSRRLGFTRDFCNRLLFFTPGYVVLVEGQKQGTAR